MYARQTKRDDSLTANFYGASLFLFLPYLYQAAHTFLKAPPTKIATNRGGGQATTTKKETEKSH